jgi:hypothetical protein
VLTGSGFQITSIQKKIKCISQELNRTGLEVGHSHSSSGKAKNQWDYTSTPLAERIGKNLILPLELSIKA